MQSKKRIVFVNGTRADFGLMLPILKKINKNPKFKLQVYACGMHLMKDFGYTIELVNKEFPNVKLLKVIFRNDTRKSMSLYIGELIKQLTYEFSLKRPDIVLVVGDRIEMFATAITALYLGITVAHIHGGDKSGTVDDSARHAISKIAHLHFAPSKIAVKRLKKLGEEDWRIHLVGAPALDTILYEKLPSKKELFQKLKLPLNKKIILITQHPVSEEIEHAEKQISITLNAAKKFKLPIVIIYPNADTGGRKMIKIINKEKNNPLVKIFPNLDYHLFLALEREASAWIGNSSAGLIDSTSFKTPVVNIGTRQKDRLKGKNVIDADYNKERIYHAIYKCLYDKNFLKKVRTYKSPWGNGTSADKIISVLEKITINKKLFMKDFVL